MIMKQYKSGQSPLLITDILNPFFPEIVRAVADAAEVHVCLTLSGIIKK